MAATVAPGLSSIVLKAQAECGLVIASVRADLPVGCDVRMQKDVDSTLRVLESGFAHLANQPTVGLYYLREHICSAAPTVVEDYRDTRSLSKELERGRADAESASECMTGLKAACNDKLSALEDRIAAAMEAAARIQHKDHRHHWASEMAHTLTPGFLLPARSSASRK